MTDCPANILSFVEVRGRRREWRKDGKGREGKKASIVRGKANLGRPTLPAPLRLSRWHGYAKSVTVNDDKMTSLSSPPPIAPIATLWPFKLRSGDRNEARVREWVHRHLRRSNAASHVVHGACIVHRRASGTISVRTGTGNNRLLKIQDIPENLAKWTNFSD